MRHLKNQPRKKRIIKLAQFGGFLMLALLLMGVLYGLISVMVHQLMRQTHHLGQIAMMIDLITRTMILLIVPFIIVLYFRFMDDRKLWTKIHFKTYFELFIILACGLLLSSIPNGMVLSSLLLTHVMQFFIFTMLNTLLITAVMTTCKNRGVLL